MDEAQLERLVAEGRRQRLQLVEESVMPNPAGPLWSRIWVETAGLPGRAIPGNGV
jgi:hypothetical protein